MLRRLANRMLNDVERVVAREAAKALAPHIQSATEGLINAVINQAPSIRSTGGATSVYLDKVCSDFKDFHPEDADSDIQTFILELLQLQYEGKANFEKAKVSEKVLLNVNRADKSTLSNIKFNNMAIADYQKSLHSATLKYRASVGFDANRIRQEKLYEIEYTLQLRDDFGEKTFLECKNCGASLEESDGECKYCGVKHLRDTISNWVITDCREK